tara:strand:- start:355 stop:762 length:408 start_codon:yes stop_codon:yes gene_type:complete
MNTKETKLIIYTNPNCPYCLQVKENLDKANIEYIEKDTIKYKDEWISISRLTGIPTTPTLIHNGDFLVPGRDFASPALLVKLIQEVKQSDYSQQQYILERLKSLNYNMAVAFGRTDKILREIETKINTNEHKSTD